MLQPNTSLKSIKRHPILHCIMKEKKTQQLSGI